MGMVSSVYWEWEFLIQTIKLGVKAAFIYDAFLLFRMLIPHKRVIVSIEDMIYWMYITVIIFQLQMEQTNGILRGYSILGMVLGMGIYNKLLGENIIALAEKWISFVKMRLKSVRKILRIKLGKHKCVSEKNRRENGKKKNSSEKIFFNMKK